LRSNYDIIVVGGGHAGIEAAWAASQLGARTAMITMQREAIGRMSCNPAIGGLGKGQMVREIDALGGLMALAIDRAGIQFRMLNLKKGPAVWAPRAQADRAAYASATLALLAQARNLDILEGSVERLQTREASGDSPYRYRITGVAFDPSGGSSGLRTLRAPMVILATGTFMRGLMHCGENKTVGGRMGEAAAVGISGALESLGFTLGRLKTGTPPRVHRDSLDYDRFEPQPGDEIPTPFSVMTDGIRQPQIQCWITYTNPTTHDAIRANLHRAPLYSGQIDSTGPRYCPSIEDKIVRFADKERHQIFLEPEGYDNERIYCNGISTSLPADVQEAMVRSIPGMKEARILQYGYAIEYDWVPTHQIRSSLEAKPVGGLFLAGQINGTSGYEEAAGQGILAGLNAVRGLGGEDPVVLGRDQAYLGVMIDDLITRPPIEPYRMFTSRAEYRLFLRSDNAGERLTPVGRRVGLVDQVRWERFKRMESALSAIDAASAKGHVNGLPLSRWVRRPDADVATFADALYASSGRVFSTGDLWHVLVRAKYSGYLERQDQQIARFRRLESATIPPDVDYAAVPAMRAEARENLSRVQPLTLGQAARITGITPADVTILWVYLTSRRGRDGRGQA